MDTKYSRIQSRQKERGSVIVLITFAMVAFFAFAALSIDVARVYQQLRDLQSGTDSGALAGAALLAGNTNSAAVIITEASNIAQANGISNAEITASNYGTIQVGQWNTASLTFTAGATPYNAVLVPAKRNVSLLFGKVVGFNSMSPPTHSVAMWSGLGTVTADMATNLIPFGVTTDQLASATSSGILDANLFSSGNRGKINLCGDNESGSKKFAHDMTFGLPCAVSINDSPDSGTGAADFPGAFDPRLVANPFIIMPVVDSFGPGKKSVNIEGFVAGILIPNTPGDPNSGWSGKIQLLGSVIGGSGGGSTNSPFAQTRLLVE